MACFSIVPMEKQAINFPKIVQNACDHSVKFELSHNRCSNFHDKIIQSTENVSKILKFEAPCTENYKLSLEAMAVDTTPFNPNTSKSEHPLHIWVF